MNHNNSCSRQRTENVINYPQLTQKFPLDLPCHIVQKHQLWSVFINFIFSLYISQKFTNLTTPRQPSLIQSTPTPFQRTKTCKPDYILKYK